MADSWKDQTLLNVVRIRYGDAPTFLDVSSVVASYAVQGQLSAATTVNSNLTGVAPWASATLGGNVAYQDRPTISYTPLAGEKFAKSFLRPIPPSGIFQLIQAGYPADFILQVTVRALNGIRNRGLSGGEAHPADPEFYPVLDALRRLQKSGAVSLRLQKAGNEDVGFLVLDGRKSASVQRDLRFVSGALHLTPGKNGEVFIAFGAVQRTEHELAVLSRSMAEILIELATGIEVPDEHVSSRRTIASARVTAADDPRDRPLVQIHSGANAPQDAFCAVHYRSTWYWIDDADFPSKRVFTLLMFFASLAETGVAPQTPTLTIPVN